MQTHLLTILAFSMIIVFMALIMTKRMSGTDCADHRADNFCAAGRIWL